MVPSPSPFHGQERRSSGSCWTLACSFGKLLHRPLQAFPSSRLLGLEVALHCRLLVVLLVRSLLALLLRPSSACHLFFSLFPRRLGCLSLLLLFLPGTLRPSPSDHGESNVPWCRLRHPSVGRSTVFWVLLHPHLLPSTASPQVSTGDIVIGVFSGSSWTDGRSARFFTPGLLLAFEESCWGITFNSKLRWA